MIRGMAGGLNPLMVLPHGWVHALNDGGWVHRLVNVLGCALMLGGNYLSRLYGGGGGGSGGVGEGSDRGGGAGCWVPGCGRPDCEVDAGTTEYGEGGVGGVQGVDSSFFQVERPKD